MSASDSFTGPTRGVPGGDSSAHRVRGRQAAPNATASHAVRIGMLPWSKYAWGAAAATAGFIVLTCWWLTQDRSIPIYDAGDHLEVAFKFHDMIRAGNLLGPFNYESPYPPLGALVGAIATFVGGVDVASPIVGENLVFVPLLVLGCYQTGRLLFGPRAGLLAAIFVLGSPLLIAQLHVFMLDAPETALVAVTIWLLLACEHFSRVRFAALAGLAVGIGMLIKVQFAPFVVGIVLMSLVRGWRGRNYRGFVVFAAIALVVATPWYLNHLAEFSTFTRDASAHEGVPVGDVPPTLSLANFAWYFWNMLNSQFLVALFALIVGGTAWMFTTLLRQRREAIGAIAGRGAGRAGDATGVVESTAGTDSAASPATLDRSSEADVPVAARPIEARLDFFVGAIVAWLLITLTPSHDIRYGMPMMPYLAVIATGWIVYLPRRVRLVAIAVVVLGVTANTLSTTFGVGGTVQVKFANPLPAGEELADSVRFYSNEGFLVAGPRRDGDVPGLLVALRRSGVRTVAWSLAQSTQPDFSFEGLGPLARIAELSPAIGRELEFSHLPSIATLIHEPVLAHSPPTCTRLSDGTGVWVVRYDTATRKLALFCPYRRPEFYDSGAVG